MTLSDFVGQLTSNQLQELATAKAAQEKALEPLLPLMLARINADDSWKDDSEAWANMRANAKKAQEDIDSLCKDISTAREV